MKAVVPTLAAPIPATSPSSSPSATNGQKQQQEGAVDAYVSPKKFSLDEAEFIYSCFPYLGIFIYAGFLWWALVERQTLVVAFLVTSVLCGIAMQPSFPVANADY